MLMTCIIQSRWEVSAFGSWEDTDRISLSLKVLHLIRATLVLNGMHGLKEREMVSS